MTVAAALQSLIQYNEDRTHDTGHTMNTMLNTRISYEEYDNLPGVRAGALCRMRASPLHYRYPPEDSDTASRMMLRAIHSRVLEPDVFATEFTMYDGVRRGREYDACVADHRGMTILNRREWETSQTVAEAVRHHSVAGPYLTGKGAGGGESEITQQWIDKTTGIHCKARIDRLALDTYGRPVLLDLKSYGSTDPRVVASRIVDNGAHIQLAHYLAGLESARMIVDLPAREAQAGPRVMIVSCEIKEPYDVAVFELDDDAIDLGRRLRRKLLDRLAQCLQDDKWPGRFSEVQELTLPEWSWRELTGHTMTEDSEIDPEDVIRGGKP